MKFICSKTELLESLGNVSHAAAVKSSMDTLEGVKFSLRENELEMTGYDLSMGIKKTINVNSGDRGDIVINPRLLLDIIRRMPEDVINISISENYKVNISSGAVTYDIDSKSAEEYPDIPPVDESEFLTIQQNILKSMINQTIFAVSTKDTKPVLTGELFDIENGIFNLVAIDGFRLAVRTEKIDTDKKFNFVVPSRTLSEVSKLLDDSDDECKITVGNKHVLFEISGYIVITRLLEGEFHNYKSSIPSKFSTEAIVKVREMLDTLDRCSLLISEMQKAPVRLNFSEGKLDVNCFTLLGKVNDSMDIDINGSYFEIGFNNRYLTEALRASDVDKVKFLMNSPLSAIKIVPLQGDSFTFLTLPMMINNN